MERKKRILWVSEASFLNTGFSVLSNEILQRLYKTGKYEIAELGSYVSSEDPRVSNVPWKFYGAIPSKDDELGQQRYQSSIYGQFGEAVFEQTCLDFQCDVCIDVRDRWMSSEWQLKSPFRKYFKYILMPTVDGEPQRLEWLDDYSRADYLLTYSKYGKDTLEREAPDKIKVVDVVRPGVDPEVYKPMDKKALRKYFDLPEDSFIVTTVMRNQKRKLYPDLIEMFRGYLDYCKTQNREDLIKKTYLYLHASYPDVGYDIGKYILDFGVGHKVLMTYQCAKCNSFYPDFFQTEVTTCKKCGELACRASNTQNGLSREDLAKIINLADLYIQYSICEGLGMPIAEAKACGIPAMGVDYSAVSEQVNVLGCCPIKVQRFFYESVIETEQKRALPDNQDAIEKIFQFFNLPEEKRIEMGQWARKDAAENYSFDRSAKIYENLLDSIKVLDTSKTWNNPTPHYLPKPKEIPQNLSNSDFIDWCFDNIISQPELKNTYWKYELVKGLNVGFIPERGGKQKFDRESCVNMFANLAKSHDFWEYIRTKPFRVNEKKVLWQEI